MLVSVVYDFYTFIFRLHYASYVNSKNSITDYCKLQLSIVHNIYSIEHVLYKHI